jgi:ATPase subunit of ABC transporter with duplicated ATPase domains
MISLDSISKTMGSRTLFEKVSITFDEGNRYALTGPNGCGKSTLLKIIMGMETATSGNLNLPPRLGFLRQNIEDFHEFRVIDCIIMGNQRLWDAFTERDKLYEEEITDEIGMRLGDLEGIIAEEDGYSAESDAEILLSGTGIAEEYYEQPLGSIPLDLQFRVLLCQALFGDPQALILDEPTNHLDLESITWLSTFLETYKGTLIVVSHDRHFLNKITTHIADIDYETIIIYPGNYDDMVMIKTSTRSRVEHDAKSKEVKIAKLKEFVTKFRSGTRASQVQSRLKEIQRLQPKDLKQSNIQRPYIRFPLAEKPSGRLAINIEDISKSYEDKEVIKDFTLEIYRGEKIGVIGNNGRGKTTLLRMLSDYLAGDSGKISYGHQAILSYFPQNHADVIDKNEKCNAFDWLLSSKKGLYEQEIRGVLGKMLFGGDDAFKNVPHLSGGETARIIIARMMLEDHNVIILDEPNNHLDLEAVSALAWGLQEYKGTVVVASHDYDLINSVATKIIAFEDDGIHIHHGTLDEYLAEKAAL